MSIKLMSTIFETEMRHLSYEKEGESKIAKASTCKLVLLAIADHANDYGEGSYPGFDKLQTKTGLSRGGLADTLEALQQNGLLLVDKRGSRFGTNTYTINIRSFPPMNKETNDLPTLVYPVDQEESTEWTSKSLPSRPDPSVKPSVKPIEEEGQALQTRNVFKVFEEEIGVITPMIAQSLEDDEREHGPSWVCEAIKIASQRGARNYKYVSAILKRWKTEGYGTELKKNGKQSKLQETYDTIDRVLGV